MRVYEIDIVTAEDDQVVWIAIPDDMEIKRVAGGNISYFKEIPEYDADTPGVDLIVEKKPN